MPKAQLPNDLSIHYEQVGAGPDLVMVHGIGGNLAAWHFRIVPSFWADHNVLTYDLRGHGYSDMTENGYTAADQAEDLKNLLDFLDIETTDIVGHSFGADIALYFCYLYPERVRRAILIEAMVPALVPSLTRKQFEKADWMATALAKMGIPVPEDRRLDIDYMLREAQKLPNQWGPLKNMPAQWTSDRMLKLYTETRILKDAIEIGPLTLDQLKTINVPIHLVYDSGSLLWRRAHRYLEQSLPNMTSVLLKTKRGELAHFSPLEKPDVVIEQIRRGLAGSNEPTLLRHG